MDIFYFIIFIAIAICLFLAYSMIQDCWKYIHLQDKQIEILEEKIKRLEDNQ